MPQISVTYQGLSVAEAQTALAAVPAAVPKPAYYILLVSLVMDLGIWILERATGFPLESLVLPSFCC
jgi:hypothetical protein